MDWNGGLECGWYAHAQSRRLQIINYNNDTWIECIFLNPVIRDGGK